MPLYSESRELEKLASVEHIPHKHWDEVSQDIYKRWRPDTAPHHSIICLTGGGKSYLYTRGLLPMRGWRRCVILDVKGDDPTSMEWESALENCLGMILGCVKDSLIPYGIDLSFTTIQTELNNK